MKRVRDCLVAPVIPEAKLVLVAMSAGRLKEATLMELVDLLEEPIGSVALGLESLRIARINVSGKSGLCILAPEWQPDAREEAKNAGSESVSSGNGPSDRGGVGEANRGPVPVAGDHVDGR